jgi:oxygen-independent coproporphyrinogen-3 oxidase
MAGIYIHIPFCKKACHYCNFHFSTTLNKKEEILNAIHKEIILSEEYLDREQVNTIYFGGGTPSLLQPQEVCELLNKIREYHTVNSNAEITLEANPDDLADVDDAKIEGFKACGVNRLSIGVQSFFDQDLKYMNRSHNGDEACYAVKRAMDCDMNMSIDLIYGTPTMNDKNWLKNLKTAFDLKVPHVSSYCLTVEPKTALDQFIKTGKSKPISEEQSRAQFAILMDEMEKNDYDHYEISNFCKSGRISKHNSNYWCGEKYLGLGPSAHSFNGVSRQWNLSNNSGYINALRDDKLYFDVEVLSKEDRYNEMIMIGLRTKNGVSLETIEAQFGFVFSEQLKRDAIVYVEAGLLNQDKGSFVATREGKMVLDKISSDLFCVSK